MRPDIYIFLLFLLLVQTSCRDTDHDQGLEVINNLTTKSPALALDSLAKINVKELSRADRHYYDFLTVKAKDKAYITHTSDSLILDVINYYKSSKDKTLYSEALYYGGRVYSDLGDYPTALNYFHQALDKLPEEDMNSDLESRIVSQTGRLLNTLRLYDEAIPYVKRSIEIDSISNDTINWVYDLLLESNILNRVKKYNEAESAILKGMSLGSKGPSTLRNMVKLYLAETKSQKGMNDSALLLIRHVSDSVSKTTRQTALAYMAEIYFKAEKYDSAYYYCERLIHDENEIHKAKAFEILLSPELRSFISNDSLRNYFELYKNVLENKYNKNESNLAVLQQSIYNYELHDRERKKTENTNRILVFWILICVIVILTVIIVSLIINVRNKKKIIKLQSVIERISTLRQQNKHDICTPVLNISSGETIKPVSSKTVEDLRRELRQQLESLQRERSINNVKSSLVETTAYKMLLKHVNAHDSIKDDDPLWMDIENEIETAYPFFRNNLVLLSGNTLSRQEIRTVMLIKFGLTPNEIGLLCGITRSGIGSRKDSISIKLFGEKLPIKDFNNLISLL